MSPIKASVTVNFGPSFILRHDIYGANAISELQPLSPEERKVGKYIVLFIVIPGSSYMRNVY